MTEFWILCALLLAVALLFVMWPLWRGAGKSNAVVRDAANLEILRDQLAEMEADLANGLLTPELYEQGKRELQARVQEEVKSAGGTNQPRNPLRVLAIVLAVVLPVAALGLYWKLGNLNAFLPQDKFASADGGLVLSPTALQELQDKLAKNPHDPESWLLLARSYAQLERYDDAAKAYDKLTQLVPNEAQLWADYADALAMTQGESLAGKPTELINQALLIDPNNPKALALGGSAAMARGDYAVAIRDWENLLQQLPNKDSEDAKMIQTGLQMARDFLARSGKGKGASRALAGSGAAAGGERISGTVMLSDAMRSKADQNDTVFILARAENGPPMPLAVMRRQVKDLPFQFTLDDQMAMTPRAKLSNFDRVMVIARVSKSGNAMPQPGDLQGSVASIKPGSAGLKVTIDTMVH